MGVEEKVLSIFSGHVREHGREGGWEVKREREKEMTR